MQNREYFACFTLKIALKSLPKLPKCELPFKSGSCPCAFQLFLICYFNEFALDRIELINFQNIIEIAHEKILFLRKASKCLVWNVHGQTSLLPPLHLRARSTFYTPLGPAHVSKLGNQQEEWPKQELLVLVLLLEKCRNFLFLSTAIPRYKSICKRFLLKTEIFAKIGRFL